MVYVESGSAVKFNPGAAKIPETRRKPLFIKALRQIEPRSKNTKNASRCGQPFRRKSLQENGLCQGYGAQQNTVKITGDSKAMAAKGLGSSALCARSTVVSFHEFWGICAAKCFANLKRRRPSRPVSTVFGQAANSSFDSRPWAVGILRGTVKSASRDPEAR
jgi:hypothetical protein